jgi:hypothetical protein
MFLSDEPWPGFQAVAVARGHGPNWTEIGKKGFDRNNFTLTLVKDDVPIQGRVLDLQGKPVAGASVRLIRLETHPEGSRLAGHWVDAPGQQTTGKDGRFRLTGIGRDRVAVLRIDGPTIDQKEVRVFTRPARDGKTPRGHYSATFDHVAGPTRPIVGVVRDRETKKPLAGVVISSSTEDHNHNYNQTVHAVTDARGRYRLVGLPKKSSYALWVRPRAGQHFLPASRTVSGTEGLKPLEADFDLRRGVPVRFRMIDPETGQTVRGSALYDVLYDNPLRPETLGQTDRSLYFQSKSFVCDRDGYFNLVAVPGGGLVEVHANYGPVRYLPARVSAADLERFPKLMKVPFLAGGLLGSVGREFTQGYHVWRWDKTDQVLKFDIPLYRGRTVQGKVLGPDGKPLRGVMAYGLGSGKEEMLATEAFTATGIDPREGQTLTFVHKDRKLIGHAVVKVQTKPVVVRLQPWGVLIGRLVDDRGKPIAGVRVKSWHGYPTPGLWPPDGSGGEVQTGRDGRFRLEYLVPAVKRELLLAASTKKGFKLSAGDRLRGLTVKAGEVKDLGDVTVRVVREVEGGKK